LVHAGEVEVAMPAATACKLRVQGRRARIHRTGAKEMYDKLGVDGTVRRTALKLAGCSKIFNSRTEMLRELNTTGIPSNDALRRKRLKGLRRKIRPSPCEEDNGEGGCTVKAVGPVPSVVERLQEWDEKRKRKVLVRLERQRQMEEAQLDAARSVCLFAPRGDASDRSQRKVALTSDETEALLQRMTAHSNKRVERNREFDARISEGMRKLEHYSAAHRHGADMSSVLKRRPSSAARIRKP